MDIPDDIVKAIAVALLFAHVAVLVVVLRSRGKIGWMIGLNLLVSAGVMIYWAPRLSELFGYVDLVVVFVGFELVVLIVSILAALRVRIPPAIHWTAFAANALLSVNALVFMLTFRITRLM
jgi:hypothetical protein